MTRNLTALTPLPLQRRVGSATFSSTLGATTPSNPDTVSTCDRTTTAAPLVASFRITPMHLGEIAVTHLPNRNMHIIQQSGWLYEDAAFPYAAITTAIRRQQQVVIAQPPLPPTDEA